MYEGSTDWLDVSRILRGSNSPGPLNGTTPISFGSSQGLLMDDEVSQPTIETITSTADTYYYDGLPNDYQNSEQYDYSEDLGAAMATDPPRFMTIGGLSLESWQIIVWTMAAAIIGGILIATLTAYVNYRKRMSMVCDISKRTSSSSANQMFMEGKRYDRRNALATTSMDVELGNSLLNKYTSMRSGVTSVSTPRECLETGLQEECCTDAGRNNEPTDSVCVGVGSANSAMELNSVRSGITAIATPRSTD